MFTYVCFLFLPDTFIYFISKNNTSSRIHWSSESPPAHEREQMFLTKLLYALFGRSCCPRRRRRRRFRRRSRATRIATLRG